MMDNFLVGAFLIAVGFIVGTSGVGVADIGFSSFDDHYPDNQTWGQFGQHVDTKTSEQGYLTLQDNIDEGVFASDTFTPEGDIDIETVIYETSNLGNNRRINLVIGAVNEEGAITETFETELKEGRYSADLGNFTTEDASSYYFDVELFDDQGTTSNKPYLETLQISGTAEVNTTNKGISTGLQWLLIFVGLYVVVRGAF